MGTTGGDVDRYLVQFGRRHLRGDGALPDQLVDPALLVIQVFRDISRGAVDVRGSDRFVGFLGVLRLGAVFARGLGQVVQAELLTHMATDGADRLLGQLHAVGPHVADQAGGLTADFHTFIELLGDPHSSLGTKAQLAAGVHLERAGHERRLRVALDPAALDAEDAEIAGFDGFLRRSRLVGIVDVELVELLAVQMGQPGGERRASGRREMRLDRPVFARLERLDLGFALADQPQGDGLHPAGAAAAGQLAPQHRGQGEADEVVQCTPGEVGLDQRLVQVAGMRHGVLHGGFGDLVERDALYINALQHLLLFQHRPDVPRYGLAFAIRVGGEPETVGTLHRLRDGGDLAGAALIGGPIHGKAFLGPHAAILGGKVAHMAEAGEHGKATTQILVDGLGFGG